MRQLVLVVLSLVSVYAHNDLLRSVHPLYGISIFSDRLSNSSVCREELQKLTESIEEEHVWAIKALDASGRPESGFIYGNNFWIGSHLQCQDISNTKQLEVNNEKIKHAAPTPYDYPPFKMGFAMVYIRHNNTLQYHTQLPLEWTIQLGLCLPASCSREELFQLSQLYFSKSVLEFQKLLHLDLKVEDAKILVNDYGFILLLPKTIILLIICTIVIVCSILGTILDVRRHNREKNLVTGYNESLNGKSINFSNVELLSKPESNPPKPRTVEQILKCFSIYSNTKNLFSTKLSSDSIKCIHGLRFLGMLWVISVHAIFFQGDYLKNVPNAYRISEDFLAQTFSNSSYCVDTYLFLSGFLVAYLYYKTKNPHKAEEHLNYFQKVMEFFKMYINRYLRLTPPYVVLLMLSNVMYTFYRHTSSLTSSEQVDVTCDKYWWRNLLYINNLYPRSEMCLSWSWYLALDTQFFVLITFLLILSTVAFQLSAIVALLMIVICGTVTGYKSYIIGYIPTMDEQLARLDDIYDLPWNRIGPYLVGGITAYILKIKWQNKLELSKKTKTFLWTVFPLLNLWIVFSLYTRQISLGYSTFFMGTSRILWGVGIAWVVVACCTGNARALDKFLSFKGFVPLSRLTYSAYLLNPLAANMVYLGADSSFNISRANFAVTTFGVCYITFVMAYLFSLLFETPFILLTKMAMNKLLSRKAKRVENQNTIRE